MSDISIQLMKRIGHLESNLRAMSAMLRPLDWRSMPETLTYASATTFTATGDYTATYQEGDYVRWTQSSTLKFGRLTHVAYSDPTTTFTLVGDVVADADIEYPAYSRALNPFACSRGYIFYPEYATSEDWDGDAKDGADGIIDLSSAFSLPPYIKAISCRMRATDETVGVVFRLSKDSGDTGNGIVQTTQVASQGVHIAGIVPCDSNGDVYFSQSGELDAVTIEITGYFI